WLPPAAPRPAPPRGGGRGARAPHATDTAFVHVLRGIVALRSLEVTATVTGLLPLDDGISPHQLS
ncbi:transglutaminase family protein, partial [Frankia sp. AgPm24]|nr:transglutaminase family protein [Frankia sp. AgPm24]